MRTLMGQVLSWKQESCSLQASPAPWRRLRPGSKGQGQQLQLQVRVVCERTRWLEQPAAPPSVDLAYP